MGFAEDDAGYARYTPRMDRDRDVNELRGLIEGIAIDGRITPAEAEALSHWCNQPRNWHAGSLFREVRDRLGDAVSDGILDDEERADLLYWCDRLTSPSPFYSVATADMQRLHGMLGGVGADGVVSMEELHALREWMENVEHLRGTWPYDEVDSLITQVLSDRRIDAAEQEFLVGFTRSFLASTDGLAAATSSFAEDAVRRGICAVDPQVTFEGKRFCVTGSSPLSSRRQILGVIEELGGVIHKSVVKKLDYLIVAADRSLHWAFSCYGRKVEAAMALRRDGAHLVVVHESDFWDAARDHGWAGCREGSVSALHLPERQPEALAEAGDIAKPK